MNVSQDRIDIVRKTLLRARPDVHAHPWQAKQAGRDGKYRGGWSPHCIHRFDPKLCPLSQKNNLKGNCGSCERKEYAPLDDKEIAAHLTATTPVQPGATNLKEHIGLYLLLPSVTMPDGTVLENVCFQMAADFDDHADPSTGARHDPARDVKAFLAVCEVQGIHGLVERSKSGKGFHVWFFFPGPIEAFLGRRVLFALQHESGCLDDGDDLNSPSFDRIFPSQDRLTGKGLGNLIAAPLCGAHMKKGNTLFVDPQNGFTPFEKQAPLLTALATQIDAGQGDLLVSRDDLVRVASELKVDVAGGNQPQESKGTTALPSDAGARINLEHCAFLQHCRDQAASLPEPQWMDMISNLCRFSDGNDLIHDLSRGHPNYTPQETNGKIAHLRMSSGPVTCEKIRADGFKGCPRDGCGVKAPAGLAARMRGEHITALIDDIDPSSLPDDVPTALDAILNEISMTARNEHEAYLEQIAAKLPKAKKNELKKAVIKKQEARKVEALSRDDFPNYRIQNNCYEKKHVEETGHVTYQPFTNFIIDIKSDRQFIDEVEPYRLIEGEIRTACGKAAPFQVSGKVFANSQRLNEALGEQGGTVCKYWPHDINDIRRAAQELSTPRYVAAHTRLGFIDPANDRYYTPSLIITPHGVIENRERVIDLSEMEYAKSLDLVRLDPETLARVCRHILDDLFELNGHEVTFTLAGHAFISPFLSKLDHSPNCSSERYILWITGITGASKSFLAMRFANFFGNFAEGHSVNSWTSTPYQIQKVGHYFADCLYLVDDFKLKNIQARHEQVVQILQNYADGRGRGRLNSDASVKQTYTIRGNLLVTGEDVPDNEASNLARMIIVGVNTRRKDAVRGRACLKNQHLYRGVTAAFIHHVLSRPGWFDDLVARIDAATDMFHEGVEDVANGLRIARNFGLNKTGFDLFVDFLQGIGVVDEAMAAALIAEHIDNLFGLRDEHTRSVVSEQANNVFLDTLTDMLHSGRVVLHSPENKIWRGMELVELEPHEVRGVVGFMRRDDEHAYIYPKIALAEIQKVLRDAGSTLGFTIKAIGKQLAEEGFLFDCENGRASTTVRHNGRTHRVWKIRKADLGLTERSGDDDIPF